MTNLESFIIPIFGFQTICRENEIENDNQSSNIFDRVYQKIEETIGGNGFFVGDFLVTAAHVITDTRSPFIIWREKRINLKKEDAILWMTTPCDKEGMVSGHDQADNADIAIFKIEDTNSPLYLADTLPDYGDQMVNYHHRKNSFIQSQAVVGDKDYFLGNFFGCTMTPAHPTTGGSSGSPLLKGNAVYGILHAGNKKNPSICIFSSAEYALRMLRVKLKEH